MNLILPVFAVFIGCLLYRTYYQIRYLAGVQRRVRHQKHHRFRWKAPSSLHGFADRPSGKNPVPVPVPEPVEGEPVERERVEGQPSARFLSASKDIPPSPFPPVSVIVCARNEADNLRHYLQALTCQKYPEFEVIVVNDGSEDDTQLVLEQSAKLFHNLRLTFVPHDAWVRSSKKLALTLAAKAAKYDYLLLTDADCRPESPRWIEEMMRGFSNPETEVVLGYSGYFSENSFVNRLIQYDTVFSALTYLGHALSRHPYMGVGRNLAYKKETFFRHNGFAGTLSQRAGDDDLFVNKIANRHNTEVVLTPDSYTWSVPKRTFAEWRIQKYRHLSVAPSYRLSTRLRLTAEPLIRGLWYASFIALIVLLNTPFLLDGSALAPEGNISPLSTALPIVRSFAEIRTLNSQLIIATLFLLSFLAQVGLIARAKRIFRVPQPSYRFLSLSKGIHLPSYLFFDL